ncbi:uncharacterized protein F4822DRAFT_92033 [Hypoxylon trugodes]|uniref:uncharacterized protein n=1 Tax=Hypoxylon trugodes TaxID=326681 RepID=UPI00219FF228|nr:uncharacterized protein F4822DRAFT_92033 [Hypoxylon trugodes]KAI1383089.1 hypothetical protein F4822DRAFT_92033 [Hypoxylon trugodes]
MFRPISRGLFTGSPRASLIPSTQTTTAAATSLSLQVDSTSRSIHTTAPRTAYQNPRAPGFRGGDPRTEKKGNAPPPDPRITNLKVSMPRTVPAPLRFARNRYLRHWTIHRAWQLYQRQEREREQHELERMYQSMHNACEELRKTSGPGTRDEGYLYRVAMEKKGAYGHNGIPIEYARPLTETPAREPWNYDWKR